MWVLVRRNVLKPVPVSPLSSIVSLLTHQTSNRESGCDMNVKTEGGVIPPNSTLLVKILSHLSWRLNYCQVASLVYVFSMYKWNKTSKWLWHIRVYIKNGRLFQCHFLYNYVFVLSIVHAIISFKTVILPHVHHFSPLGIYQAIYERTVTHTWSQYARLFHFNLISSSFAPSPPPPQTPPPLYNRTVRERTIPLPHWYDRPPPPLYIKQVTGRGIMAYLWRRNSRLFLSYPSCLAPRSKSASLISCHVPRWDYPVQVTPVRLSARMCVMLPCIELSPAPYTNTRSLSPRQQATSLPSNAVKLGGVACLAARLPALLHPTPLACLPACLPVLPSLAFVSCMHLPGPSLSYSLSLSLSGCK